MTSCEILVRNLNFMLWYKNMKKVDIVKISGVDPGYISRIFRGNRQNISLRTLDRIATAFNIDSYLLLKKDFPETCLKNHSGYEEPM